MISILSKAATWFREQPFGEAFSCVFSSPPCSAQLIWTAVTFSRARHRLKVVFGRLPGPARYEGVNRAQGQSPRSTTLSHVAGTH